MTVTPEEMAETREWVAAKFQGVPHARPAPPGLVVLANHDPVHQNARGGRPLKIVNSQYTRGLYCHAYSKIIVRLPGPGKTLSAIAGVDSNEQTSGGRGSVVFAVYVGGKEAFRSDVRREGMPAVPVEVDLGGATEFAIEVGDAGDGISCDQADWAEAKVAMADGTMVWLGEMALFDGPQRGPFTTDPPFSFTYDGKPSAELLKGWELKRAQRKLDDQRIEHALTYRDPQSGLIVRCVAVEYHDFPTVEWTLYFKNGGAADTPILSDIQALDTRFERSAQGEFVLHHHVGSICAQNDFQPLDTPLGPKAEKRITTSGGRPSNSDWPYFNLEAPGEGTIVAIGWPGQWAAQFDRDDSNGLRVRAGQELTHFRLHPNEEVRSPLIVLQFYKTAAGDRARSQNIWRRWMIAHNLPRPGGQLPAPRWNASSSLWYEEMGKADEASQIQFIDGYLKNDLKIDFWWMDAGWYFHGGGGWPRTGTWEVDTQRFPRGLRAVTDYAHSKGIKIIVWFEPERVAPETWLAKTHQWLLGKDGEQKLLNLGNPEARQWLTDHVDKLLTEQGIDLYRQDFNMEALPYWRANDTEDRQGITEIRHVEGYLAYWDELQRRHPNTLFDTCASGGRRDDLETLRRAVPLHRSDYIFEPVGQQCHTYGLAMWVPFYGIGINTDDPYIVRSMMCPSFGTGPDLRREGVDYSGWRRRGAEWRSIAPYFYGDYYPLTPYSLDNHAWLAWQFDRPDLGEGVVQAFRRTESFYESARFKLQGLEPDAHYVLTDCDDPTPREMTGRELMEQGLLVAIKAQPGAAIITYRVTVNR